VILANMNAVEHYGAVCKYTFSHHDNPNPSKILPLIHIKCIAWHFSIFLIKCTVL
jgi:hypothetical protein